MKATYIVLSPVRMGHKVIPKGAQLQLTEAEARWEVAAGRLEKEKSTSERPVSSTKKR